MNNHSISIPDGFRRLCEGLNAHSFHVASTLEGVAVEAAKYVPAVDRAEARAFIELELERASSEKKLVTLLRNSGADVYLSAPPAARILLKALRDAL